MRRPSAVVCFCLVACASIAFAQEQKLTADELVARHLDSIGTAQARAGLKSRTAQATTKMDMVVGKAAHAEGMAMMVSLGRQLSIAMKFPANEYPNEQFVFDGKNVNIGLTGPGTRSRLGDWLYREDALMRESLIGGTLLTSWALFDVPKRQAKLRYDGLKKLDGRDLHDLVYFPKKGADNDLLVHLYFEPDTFRHVKTVYTFNVPPEMVHLREQTAGRVRSQAQDRSDMKYRVEETFSDFRTQDGVTFPGHWRLQYTTDAFGTLSAVFDFTVGTVAHNNVVD